jgi:hypothetical protein
MPRSTRAIHTPGRPGNPAQLGNSRCASPTHFTQHSTQIPRYACPVIPAAQLRRPTPHVCVTRCAQPLTYSIPSFRYCDLSCAPGSVKLATHSPPSDNSPKAPLSRKFGPTAFLVGPIARHSSAAVVTQLPTVRSSIIVFVPMSGYAY